MKIGVVIAAAGAGKRMGGISKKTVFAVAR